MLESLFGNPVIEKALFYLLRNEKGYALEMSKNFDLPLYSFQLALKRLEKGGIIVSFLVGKTRVYEFNPRYPFRRDLLAFLKTAYNSLPEKERAQYYEQPKRRRPRRGGKPL